MVKFLKTFADYEEALKSNKKVMIDFTASWCGPCKMIGPIFEKFSEDPAYKDIAFVKIDVDENAEAAEKCGI